MRVIKRNARCFRLVTSLSSSFSPLSYMDRAQNRKALCPIHFCREKAKNKQRRCGERKTGKKGEVKGLKRGKGEVKGLKREQSGGGLPNRKPAAALSFVITRPAQGENIAAPQGGKYFRAARGKYCRAARGKYCRAARGKVLPRRERESTAATQVGAGRHCGAPGCFPNTAAGRRAAFRTPQRGAGLLSERHCGAPGCFPNATAGRRAYFPNTSSAAFTSALASLQ